MIRVGIIGAGQIARARHLPRFMSLPGVKVVAVCNQHRESSARVAREFNIPKVHGTWENLIEDESIDAVVIAAWPYLHCPVTLAALDAGKHVLTQARMAMNAREAQRMFDHAKEFPNLTTMVVPSPFGLTGDAFIQSLIRSDYLGNLREIHVDGFSNDLADSSVPLGWRQMTKYSGFNMLTLGILYETALRWVSPVNRVMAYASKAIPKRIDPESGALAKVGTPDSVQVLTTQEDGSCGVYRLSGVLWHRTGMSITLHGSEGAIRYDLTRDEIFGARASEASLALLEIPRDLRGGWQVEEDFIAAIRGEREVTRTDFATGVKYMQFTEAVARSSRHQQPVTLPLREFSNPSL
ncbi:Gfo/Idh/MocA family protein [Singulisphaera sp. PoT]|uniref:Gfo/Idh/MocA family protein n=1 Tax=Singulisphaera sp. PoT TaxID=3411797 RepID=UPI003BF53DAF